MNPLATLVARYASSVDRHLPDAVAALFIPDGEVLIHDHGFDPIDPKPTWQMVGQDQIRAGTRTVNKRFKRTVHVLGQSLFDIDGDVAEGETYCVAHHIYSRSAREVDMVLVIRYLDHFVLDGDWKFASRRLFVEVENHLPITHHVAEA